MFCDELGYADVGSFGAKGYKTPHLDRMAREGVRLTNFHVASAVCSASRIALLTGCYNTRVGIRGALGPKTKYGINKQEMTIAELTKQKGRHRVFGKWHLGHLEPFLPTNHGFDEYFGILLERHVALPSRCSPPAAGVDQEVAHLPARHRDHQRQGDAGGSASDCTVRRTRRGLHRTQRTSRSSSYVPPQPHVPLYVSDKFAGKTKRGLFGDVISEIDWSIGQILDALKRTGNDRNTLVIFTSDNGPWLSYGDHAGSTGPHREGKGTSWEGGVRVPFIARWPGRIPAGKTVTEPAMTIDILPTIAGLIDGELPKHKIDGKNIWRLLQAQKGAISPQEAYWIYYGNNQLQAVISGRWKLVLPHTYRTMAGKPGGTGGIPNRYSSGKVLKPELYDLIADISETTDVSGRYPAITKQLLAHADAAYADLGDGSLKKKGPGIRPAGQLPDGN